MFQQQQQQQPTEQPTAPISPSLTQEEQFLTLITGLQQQAAILLQQSGGARVEVTKPPLFSGKIEKVRAFVNIACLYLRMKMIEESESTKMAWVLFYIQGGVVEAWKDNLLDKLSKGESQVKTAEELFSKMRNKFGEMAEKEKKVEQLRTIEQEGRTCNEYIQEFKKIARESRYERQFFIEKFKRGLSERIRRKLAEAKSPPCTIKEWQEKVVRLNRNQR